MIKKDPPADIQIDLPFVKKLIDSQFPELSHLKIKFLDAGWDNENYRLGEKYIIRIPRRTVGAELILSEINWLPKIKDQLPIDVPAPLFVGQPDATYPWQWSIVPWYDGQAAAEQLPDETEAIRLAVFLKKLHGIEFENAPINETRGDLTVRAADISKRIERLKIKTNLITDKIERFWRRALKNKFKGNPHLLHGDLHSRNIIIDHGKIAAVIDWGDITSGDPATDLCSLWMLFKNNEIRNEALKIYGASERLIEQSIGWAIFFGVIFLDTGLGNNPLHEKIGRFILRNVENT